MDKWIPFAHLIYYTTGAMNSLQRAHNERHKRHEVVETGLMRVKGLS